MIFGLTPGITRSGIMLAVLEGVALSLADCQDVLAGAGTRVEETGRHRRRRRNEFWMRILAAILNRPLKLYSGAEHGPAFGAARLARLALTGEAPESVCRPRPSHGSSIPTRR